MDRLIAKILYLFGFRYKIAKTIDREIVRGYGKQDELGYFQFTLCKGKRNLNHDWCMKHDRLYKKCFEFYKNVLFDLIMVNKISCDEYTKFLASCEEISIL